VSAVVVFSYLYFFCFFFFFSSRRRHTRSYGDWSSDVCSSDLPVVSRITWLPGARSPERRGSLTGGDSALRENRSSSDGRCDARHKWKSSRREIAAKTACHAGPVYLGLHGQLCCPTWSAGARDDSSS